jgi:hypothetical protein
MIAAVVMTPTVSITTGRMSSQPASSLPLGR